MARVNVVADQFANVWSIRCEIGAPVAAGDVLMVLESMKMEIAISAPRAGTISEICVAEGDTVEEDQPLVILDA